MTTKNYEPWYFLNADSRVVLSRSQQFEGLTWEERYAEIAEHAEKILVGILADKGKTIPEVLEGYGERLLSYFSKGWVSLATPVWNNFGRNSGLPISCFGSYIGDSISEMFSSASEIAMMTKNGGGTSFYLGGVRGRGRSIATGGTSEGPTRFAEVFDKTVEIVNQGGVRRGACAAYMPADFENSQDVLDFLSFREEQSPVKTLNIGLTFTDKWIDDLKKDIKNKEQSDKQKIWRKMLKRRDAKGVPYIMFTDNANNQKPQVYKDLMFDIVASNLCTEIMLPSTTELSFVCCLSSLNIAHWDDWKDDKNFIRDMHWFLDAVMEEFIQKSRGIPELWRAHNFANEHRALGLGDLGWHTALKKKGIAVESEQVLYFAHEVSKHIANECGEANALAASLFGEPEVLKGYGLRNTTSRAIAPTLSSSFVLGQVSAGVELDESVYYSKNVAKGEFSWRCPEFTKVLEKYGMNNETVWDDIAKHGGSVQHLAFLSDPEKKLFKTAGEVSQFAMVDFIAELQKNIDQGISFNIRVHKGMKLKEKSDLIFYAHEKGLKSIYYQINDNSVHKATMGLEVCEACSA